MMNHLTMRMWHGIWTLIHFIPLAFLVFLSAVMVEMLLKWVTKKKIEIKVFNWVCQYLWILIILSILKITGIWGGNFGISSPFDSYISLGLFEEGMNAATILNIALFIPYGFLPVFIFQNISKYWWNGILIGLAFSISIEFMQTFIGRFAQLDDVIMNTCGALVGFLIGSGFVHIYQNKIVKKKFFEW